MSNRRSGRDRLKIAILDTGIDEDDPWLDRALSVAKQEREKQGVDSSAEKNPLKGYWPAAGNSVLDECGHGTYVAYLLLTYAPDADIYVAKVSEGMSFDDTEKVVKAIEWAAGNDIDIISMSFGTHEHINAIETAIKYASGKSARPKLFFALASNYGLNEPRTFPATDSRVICVHALDGKGSLDSTNPPRLTAEANYGTLGLGVHLHWRGEDKYRTGTSYATPILAAIIANLLDWLGYHAQDEQSDLTIHQYEHIRKLDQIRKVLEEHMSVQEGNIHYVAPWLLFPCHELPSGRQENEIRKHDKEYIIAKEKAILGSLTLKMPRIN